MVPTHRGSGILCMTHFFMFSYLPVSGDMASRHDLSTSVATTVEKRVRDPNRTSVTHPSTRGSRGGGVGIHVRVWAKRGGPDLARQLLPADELLCVGSKALLLTTQERRAAHMPKFVLCLTLRYRGRNQTDGMRTSKANCTAPSFAPARPLGIPVT